MSENPNAYRVLALDPGGVLHYWDMSNYAPSPLVPGKYMTACGRIAFIKYVSGPVGDVFGYIQRHRWGPKLCCVWTWDGLIRCAFKDDDYDAWEWSIIDKWEAGVTQKEDDPYDWLEEHV